MLDLSKLNKEQKEAVVHKDGPLLIVAGAGTGKTTVLTNRVAWLIEQGLANADEILCLTFTDKAAGEMEERIDKLLPFGYVDLWVMTFHAFSERLLKRYGIEIGLPAGFRLLDQTGQWMLIHNHFDQFKLDYYKPMGAPTKFISAMMTHFSRAKDEGVSPEDYLNYVNGLVPEGSGVAYENFAETIQLKSKKKDEVDIPALWKEEIARRKEMAHAYEVYQRLLVEQNALDFGDLILYLGQLLKKRPHILAQLQSQFKYILVDEFQDTNWAQYDLVKRLADVHKNVTVVGDDDQSIYKFRGASLSNILGFKHDFPEATQVVLTQNYRSSQEILDLSHAFIQHNNPHRLEAQLSTDPDLAESAQEKSIDLSSFAPIEKNLKANTDEKGIIEHLHYGSLEEETAGVVNKIIDLRNANTELNWGDFAILVRANSSAEPFIQQLSMAEIPYQFMASQGLFSQPVILDVLSYLRLLDDYAESTALYRLLILPTVDLANDDLMELLAHCKKDGLSLRQALTHAEEYEVSPDGKDKIRLVLARLDEHMTMAKSKRVSEVAMAFIDAYELKQYFEELEPLQQRDTYALLNQFWKVMRQFEQEQVDMSVKAFLEYLQLALEAGDSGRLPIDAEHGPDSIKIMTIHASKGLEFEHVFMVNMVDRRFPTTERKDPIELPEELVQEVTPGTNLHLEEERRLCYVALTRARRGLYLTSGEDYGGARKKKLSRFMLELGFEKKEAVSLQSNLRFGESMVKSFEAKKAATMDYKALLPKTFSYSQLKVFQTCPWQYRYAFLLRIPVQGRHTFSFGKTLHHALESFFQLVRSAQQDGSEFPTKSKLLDLYEESWIDEWYKDAEHKAEHREKGQQILNSFYEMHEGNWPKNFATEQPFNLKIGNYTLRGSIDRVDEKEGKLHLIDYKTGNVPKSDRSIDKDQLTLYQIATEEVLGKEVEELTYFYLNELEERTFTIDEKKKEKLKEKFVKILDELTSSDFAPKPSSQVCKYCDYKDICQYRIL